MMQGLLLTVLVAFADPPGYAEAYHQALVENKPLVVWVGGNFCERCVKDSQNEFVHVFARTWQGRSGLATTIYVPYDGRLYHAGTVERWTVGSRDWGHVPSARRVVNEWRGRVSSTGDLSPLKLLDFGDGRWGMSHDRFWSSYQGSGGYSSQPGIRSHRTITPSRSLRRGGG